MLSAKVIKNFIFLLLFLIFLLIYLFAKSNIPHFGAGLKQKENTSEQEDTNSCYRKLEDDPENIVFDFFEGTPAPVNFDTMPKARTFYTVISKGAKSESNLAGHFRLISWGCGTDCFQYAIVDSKTGEIIFLAI